MARRRKDTPILAAGGIVLRGEPEPLVAIVQLRKNRTWVLPKGKLDKDEDSLTAAQREVLEETGYEVTVHGHLGTLSYHVGRRPKLVEFWHMSISDAPPRRLMRDVRAVEWLPLRDALDKLTHPHERNFLAGVAPTVFGVEVPVVSDVTHVARPGLWTWLRGLLARHLPLARDSASR